MDEYGGKEMFGVGVVLRDALGSSHSRAELVLTYFIFWKTKERQECLPYSGIISERRMFVVLHIFRDWFGCVFVLLHVYSASYRV